MAIRRVVLGALLAAVALAGCGGSDDGASGTSTGGESVASGGPCKKDDPVRAGTIYTMSGPAAGIGELSQAGAELAIRHINASGGILGRCVEQVLEDDGGDPTKAAQAARKLVNEEMVDFIVGPFLSSPTAVAVDVTAPAEVIELTDSALAIDAQQYPYVFHSEVTTDQQAASYIPFIEEGGWTKLGIIAVNNEYGTGQVESFNELVSGSGLEIVAEQFVETGTADMKPQMLKLRDAGAEAVIVSVVAGPDQTAVIKARNQLDWDVPLMGAASMLDPGTTENFTDGEMENVFAGQVYRRITYSGNEALPSDPAARKFIEAFKQQQGSGEIGFSISQPAGAYDEFRLAASAINGAGSLEADAVKAYLESHPYDGVTATFRFAPDQHNGVALDQLGFAYANSLNENGIPRLVTSLDQ